jgi:uncharacterized membrane protein YfcA
MCFNRAILLFEMLILPPVLLVGLGLLTGIYGTLIGLGGAVVLIPALILLWPQADPSTLTGISLAIVFVNVLSGTIAYSRQRRIDYRTGVVFAIATIPGAIIGVLITQLLNRVVFATIFGILILALSIFLLLRPRPRSDSQASSTSGSLRTLIDAKGETFVYRFNLWLGIALSFVVGFIAGLLGIGGGIVHVPAMIYLLHFPIHIATATSHFILVFTSLTGSLTHLAEGTYANYWQLILWLAVGVVPGAQFGAWLSRRLHGVLIVRLLALALAITGVRLLLLAF